MHVKELKLNFSCFHPLFQSKTFHPIFEGQDLIGRARTGMGKTLA